MNESARVEAERLWPEAFDELVDRYRQPDGTLKVPALLDTHMSKVSAAFNRIAFELGADFGRAEERVARASLEAALVNASSALAERLGLSRPSSTRQWLDTALKAYECITPVLTEEMVERALAGDFHEIDDRALSGEAGGAGTGEGGQP